MVKGLKEPKLRFSEYRGTEGWKEVKLGELLKETKLKSQGVEEVCSVAVEKGVINQIEHLGRSYAADDTSKYKRVRKGDVVYTKSPNADFKYGVVKQSFIDKDVIVSPLYLVFEPKNYNVGTLLHYYFMSSCITNNYLSSKVNKGAKNTMNINTDTFLEGYIHMVFNEKEQQKIGQFFTLLDKKINLQQSKIQSLNEYKKGLLQKVMNQEIRFKDSDGQEYPEWEYKQITEIADTSIGLVTTMTKHYVENGTPLIRNSNIKENKIITKDIIYLDTTFANANANKKFKYGDIVTVHTGNIGVSAIINEDLVGSLGFATLLTRVKSLKVYNKFLCHYYNTDEYKNFAINLSTGDGRTNYNLKDFNTAIIPIPCLEEQKKIAALFSTIDKKIEKEQHKLTCLQEQKRGLMQKMFV